MLVILAGLTTVGRSFNQDEAADEWHRAYNWMALGTSLETKGHHALALGNFIVALRQLEAVEENFPGYETKMVSYRIEMLRERVSKTKANLSTADSKVTDQYLQFIKLVDQASDERFSAMHLKALATMKLAMGDLDSIIAVNPVDFGPALETQKTMLDNEIKWLTKRFVVNRYKAPSKPSPTVSSRSIRGTTEFITATDLPETSEGPSSPSLFPGH